MAFQCFFHGSDVFPWFSIVFHGKNVLSWVSHFVFLPFFHGYPRYPHIFPWFYFPVCFSHQTERVAGISPKPFPRYRIPLRNTHLSCMIVYAYWATMNIFTKVKGCLQGLSTSVEIELRLGKRYFISSPQDDNVCNIVIFKSWIDDKPTKDWTCCHMMVSQWICGVTCFQTSPIYVYMFIYIFIYINL